MQPENISSYNMLTHVCWLKYIISYLIYIHDKKKGSSKLAPEKTKASKTNLRIPCPSNTKLFSFHACPTVGGWNPSPVDMYSIPLFTRFYTSQVVQDFFPSTLCQPQGVWFYWVLPKTQFWLLFFLHLVLSLGLLLLLAVTHHWW